MAVRCVANLGRRWILGILAMVLGQVLHAQAMNVPDSVSLTDIRFFQDQEAGRLFNEALHLPDDDFAHRLALHSAAFLQARRTAD
ncbi:MAG TPA: hypothetical protein VHS96_01210 [Bacteroidia bacterium]|nr:hypothetical protein [Bacteroidia bacterium]